MTILASVSFFKKQSQLLDVLGVEGSGLAAVEQCAEHVGLVQLRLGANGQQGVVPDPLSKVCQCCCCFDYPLVQCGVPGEDTGDGGA